MKIKETESQKILRSYVKWLNDTNNLQILNHTDNKRIASYFVTLYCIIELEKSYASALKLVGVDMTKFIEPKKLSIENESSIIKDFYLWFQKSENPVRQRLILTETRSKEFLKELQKLSTTINNKL